MIVIILIFFRQKIRILQKKWMSLNKTKFPHYQSLIWFDKKALLSLYNVWQWNIQVMSPHSSGHLGEECPVVWVEGAAGATALIALIRNELK